MTKRLLALLLLLASHEAAAEQPGRWRFVWNPQSDLYPRSVADPRRPRNVAALLQAFQSDIPQSGDFRFLVAIGDRHNLLRFFSPGTPEHLGWQLDIEARYYAQFDIENALDEVGDDERLGIGLAKGLTDAMALRLTFFHTSSHMGDEYLLRNRITERISSRKEELAAGASWSFDPRWQTYVEAGYGVNLGRLNKPGRLQAGLEFESAARAVGQSSLWPYLALNVTSWQENEWELSTALQAGVVMRQPGSGRQYRLAIDLYDGRSQLDAFFRFRESYITVGFWLDL